RASIEILRVTLPPAGFIIVAATVLTIAISLWTSIGAALTLLLIPVIYGACCIAVLLGVALLKWIVMGRFKPFVLPLWTTYIWRLEMVNALYEFLATPLAVDALHGTPFLPWYFHLLGAKMGRGVYSQTTGLIEFDLIEVGDRVAL